MAFLLRKVNPLLQNSQLLQSRFASAAAAAAAALASPSYVQKQKSPDSAHNCRIDVPCQTTKLQSSSPCFMRTDAKNIAKAVDSAVERLERESINHLIEDDISFEIIDTPSDVNRVKVKIKVPKENMEAIVHVWNENGGTMLNINVRIQREYGDCQDNDQGKWKSWMPDDSQFDSVCIHSLTAGRIRKYVEYYLAKREVAEWLKNYGLSFKIMGGETNQVTLKIKASGMSDEALVYVHDEAGWTILNLNASLGREYGHHPLEYDKLRTWKSRITHFCRRDQAESLSEAFEDLLAKREIPKRVKKFVEHVLVKSGVNMSMTKWLRKYIADRHKMQLAWMESVKHFFQN